MIRLIQDQKKKSVARPDRGQRCFSDTAGNRNQGGRSDEETDCCITDDGNTARPCVHRDGCEAENTGSEIVH